MSIETVRAFFMWCAIINGGLLILSFLICVFARGWVYRMHSRRFPISRKTFDVAIYCFIGLMKVFFLMLSLVPYIALLISG